MSNDPNSPECFPLFSCWQDVFINLTTGLHQLIKTRELDALQIAATARLIRAVERLPLSTDVGIEASLSIKDEDSSGSLVLQLYTGSLEVGYIESFNSGVGWDNEIRSILFVETGGYSNAEGKDPISVMIELEEWVAQWTNRAIDTAFEYEISDDDMDAMWYEEDNSTDYWERLPDGV